MGHWPAHLASRRPFCHRHTGRGGLASASAQGNWPGFGPPGTGPGPGAFIPVAYVAAAAALTRALELLCQPGRRRRGSPPSVLVFAEELEADVHQIPVTAVHVAGIGGGESFGVGPGAGLFHDHVGAGLVARLEQPGVVGQPLVVCPYQPMRARVSNSWTVLWMCAPKVIQSEGHAWAEDPAGGVDRDVAGIDVPVRPGGGVEEALPDLCRGAAITMSLWANRSACSGTMPSGQRMCAERCWMSSRTDMCVPP